MTVYKLTDTPAARPDERVHVQGGNTTRGACGAGYNWPTDTQFATEDDEVTCPDCATALAEQGRDSLNRAWNETVR